MKFNNEIKDLRHKFIGKQARHNSVNGVICGYSDKGDSLVMALYKNNIQVGWRYSLFEDYIDPKYENNEYGYLYVSKNDIL